MIANRVVYGETLVDLGKKHDNIVVLDADLSASTNTYRFSKVFPERFFNMGIAEQNMMATAAGFAVEGKIPFVSTFTVFASMRACEQVRNSIAYPQLNVKIVATNGGIEIGGDGATHQSVEDLAIMRSIPNMTVVVPADPVTTRKAVKAVMEHPGPVYMRLGRNPTSILYDDSLDFKLGKAIRVKDGSDVTLIAIGQMVEKVIKVADQLFQEGISARVLDMHTLKPIDVEAILQAAKETAAIVTAEDHNIIGGLGSAVSEVVGEFCPIRIKRIGVRDKFGESGRSMDELYKRFDLTEEAILKAAKELIYLSRCKRGRYSPVGPNCPRIKS